jgi:beta-xylosidase
MTKQTNKKKKRSPFDFPFQFALKINGHIICQRGFYVKNINEDVFLSLELRELMDRLVGMGTDPDTIMGIIPKHLKAQSENYQWEKYNPFYAYQDSKKPRHEIRKDYFTFTITANDKVISSSQFENKFMLYSLDNQVDITNIISDIIKEIEYYFTFDEYTTTYLGKDLTWKSGIWKYAKERGATV